MLTASGRFSINTKLCLSMTDFHPGDNLHAAGIYMQSLPYVEPCHAGYVCYKDECSA